MLDQFLEAFQKLGAGLNQANKRYRSMKAFNYRQRAAYLLRKAMTGFLKSSLYSQRMKSFPQLWVPMRQLTALCLLFGWSKADGN